MGRRRAATGRAGGRLLKEKMADVIQHARNAWPRSATTASFLPSFLRPELSNTLRPISSLVNALSSYEQ